MRRNVYCFNIDKNTISFYKQKSILHNHNVDMYALWVLVYHKGTAPYLLTSMINVNINLNINVNIEYMVSSTARG